MLAAITLTVAALHTSGRDYERWNPGVVVEHVSNVFAGVYRNSHGRTSAVIGYRWQFAEAGKVRVAVEGGVASGYSFPVVAALTAEAGPMVLSVAPGPKFDQLVVGVGLRHRF